MAGDTINELSRLEEMLTALIDRELDRRSEQIEYLIGLNRLDDLRIAFEKGKDAGEDLERFLTAHEEWMTEQTLTGREKNRIVDVLEEIHQHLKAENRQGQEKLTGSVKTWLHALRGGPRKLVLKAPAKQESLADGFITLLKEEIEEIQDVLSRNDHLLTALDDILLSAEAKTGTMYRHLAASIIYYLKMHGYKTEPYVDRLQKVSRKIEGKNA
jgi:hypothetical protein